MEQVALTAEVLIHVAMGLGLAASAGLRAFLPLFVVGAAARMGWVPLSSSFEWLSDWPALVVFGMAVLAEFAGDKFPVVDSFLDSFQLLIKPLVGAVLMVSVVADWAPLYVTVVAIIGGGTVAGAVHVTKANLRLVSTATTAGAGNPVLSVAEDVAALAGSVGSIVVPLLVALLVLLGLVASWLLLRRRRRPLR